MKKYIPTPIIILLVLIAIVAIVLALGPCVITSNPPASEPTPEPASADETGATTP